MFRKIVSSMILLLCAFSLYAAFDLGKLSEVTVSGAKTSEDYVNSGASVVVITADDIAKLHAQSTSQVLETLTSVSLTNYGYMGSLQNVNIRGVGADKTSIYLNGACTNMAYDSQTSAFNVDSIPVDMIERIEVITSGADKSGKSFAAGGVVNIVTKKGNGEKTFGVAFENGSYIPMRVNGANALIDSQRLLVFGTDSIGDFNLAYSINTDRATNDYAYKNDNKWYARDNAAMWDLGGTLNVTGNIGDWYLSSLNEANYMNAGSPGPVGVDYKGDSTLTPDAHLSTAFISTSNQLKKDNLTVDLDYCFNPYSYEGSSNTIYKAHNAKLGANGDFTLSENLSTSLFADLIFDFAKSSYLQDAYKMRFTPEFGLSMNGDLKGLKIYPMVKLGYASDMKKFIPEGSFGLEYDFDFGLIATSNASFAVRMPTFSDLFYDNEWTPGNPNLKPESAISGDLGISYESSLISYSLSAYTKSMTNEIAWAPVDPDDPYCYVWTPSNVNRSFYWGLDQTISVNYLGFQASIGWLFNNGYDLSNGGIIGKETRKPYLRRHTGTFNVGYSFGSVNISADAKLYGKSNNSAYPIAFVMNFSVDYKPFDNFNCYAKFDNLLNTQYELRSGYPIPGLKLRLGVNYKFK